MSMTSQPGQGLPGDGQPREPGGRVLDQRPHVRAGSGAGAGDPVQHGRRAGQVQGPPHRRAARRVPQHRGQVRQHRDVAHARGAQRDRGRHRHQHDPPVEQGRRARLPQRRAQAGGQSRLVGGLAEQDRAGVADQARPAAGDLQGMVPPRYPAWRRALQSPGSCIGVVTCNLPEPGRSSPLNRQGRPLRGRPPFPSADRPAPIRCTRTQPATARNPSSQRQTIRRTAQLPISAE